MKFNENLKYLRKNEGLTQEKLAEKLNVSRQAVTKWESGEAIPDIVNLKQISILFGVTIDQLLGDEKTKNATTLEKKLKDLPLFIFGLVIVIVTTIFDFGIDNGAAIALIFISVAPFIGVEIKNYLTNRRIINLTNTEEGKKERRKIIISDTIITSLIWNILSIIIYMVRKARGLYNETIMSLVLNIIIFSILVLIINIAQMKNKVKKYNQKNA